MRVLIVGGSGMLGRFIVERLHSQAEALCLFDIRPPSAKVDNGVDFFEGDITVQASISDAIAQHRITHIVHLAALLVSRCEQDPLSAIALNINGTINILEASRRASVKRVVLASSGAVYGHEAQVREESRPLGPELSVYGHTKLMGEKLGERYSALHGLSFVALRYGLIYGPFGSQSHGEAALMGRILEAVNGQDVTIPELSADTWRHFLYVEDAAAATAAALTKPELTAHIYNVAGPEENFVSMSELLTIATRVRPHIGKVQFTGPQKSGGKMDIAKIKRDLGFVPQFSLEKTLRLHVVRGSHMLISPTH